MQEQMEDGRNELTAQLQEVAANLEKELNEQRDNLGESPTDAEQQSLLRSATHFNPVDLVCGVRDPAGRPYDLLRFVDPEAAIVTTKSDGSSRYNVLERPGLWNGAMAHWNTLFVEVPIETFSPVKSVSDLLRPEHQPAAA